MQPSKFFVVSKVGFQNRKLVLEMKTTLTTFVIFITLFANQLLAQEYGSLEKRPLSISLLPSIGTNGANAGNCVNLVSFNLISGYSAALSGIEFGGFSNSERDFVRGAQFAGFGNYVGGEFTGFQFAGFGNFNKGESIGFQFAGFANWNHDRTGGVLAAGFANFTKGESVALQFAGFLNYCQDVNGAQLAGFSNVAKGDGKVVQLAGFSNTTLGEVKGLQMAGFMNHSKGNLNGTQIAGFLNIAKQVDGLQLGFINIADTIKSGIPIGFISIVKKGFREFEISTGEALNTQVAFKIGTEKFYNIFAIGSQFLGSDFMWGFGYGIGTHLANTEKFKTQLELVSYQINEGETWTNNYNSLNQLKLTFTKKVNENFGVFIGPTINLMISDNYSDGKVFKSEFAPYDIYSHKGTHTSLKGWFGLTTGVKIN